MLHYKVYISKIEIYLNNYMNARMILSCFLNYIIDLGSVGFKEIKEM